MKMKILVHLALLLIGVSAGAQSVPPVMNYQAILTDDHGQPEANITLGVNFRIYDEAEGGNLIWGETQQVHTTPKGLFSVILGEGGPLDEPMSANNLQAAFASGTLVDQRYIEIQAMNPDGTSQSPMLPRQRFLTVPYAFQAQDGQNAAGDFLVVNQLSATAVGVNVGRLIVTNAQGSIHASGDFRVDGYGNPGVTASFASNSSVLGTGGSALHTVGSASTVTVNQAWTIAGTGIFYQAVSADNPTFKQGIQVKGGMRALGAYQSLGTNLTSLASRTAPGDGFALVYLKTDDWGEDATLNITVGSQVFSLLHRPYSAGADYDLHFYDTACIPVGNGQAWSVAFSSSGSHKNSKFDAYWIPFGY